MPRPESGRGTRPRGKRPAGLPLEGEHFPDRYRAVSSELANTKPGRLYLVAAGLLGKSYCVTLQQTGCVVIDIGAVADMWMGRKTRDFPAGAIEHDLTQFLS